MMQPLLEIDNITKKFGTFQALKGVSLTLYPGEIVSLLGVNGAGKTTLSTILATLVPPTTGTILHHGKSIFDDIAVYRRLMGYCQQKSNLNPMLTIKENLEFAGYYFSMDAAAITQRIEYVGQRLQITNYLNHKPNQLSGGYRQRCMIARACMHSPRFIILDEPTAALDPDIRRKLWELIRSFKDEGITVLLTTHYLDEAEILSDRVCVLDRGLVKLIDTPQNLMSTFQKSRLEDVFLHLTQDNAE